MCKDVSSLLSSMISHGMDFWYSKIGITLVLKIKLFILLESISSKRIALNLVTLRIIETLLLYLSKGILFLRAKLFSLHAIIDSSSLIVWAR